MPVRRCPPRRLVHLLATRGELLALAFQPNAQPSPRPPPTAPWAATRIPRQPQRASRPQAAPPGDPGRGGHSPRTSAPSSPGWSPASWRADSLRGDARSSHARSRPLRSGGRRGLAGQEARDRGACTVGRGRGARDAESTPARCSGFWTLAMMRERVALSKVSGTLSSVRAKPQMFGGNTEATPSPPLDPRAISALV